LASAFHVNSRVFSSKANPAPVALTVDAELGGTDPEPAEGSCPVDEAPGIGSLKPAGRKSEKLKPVTGVCPVFVTFNVKVTRSPVFACAGAAENSSDKAESASARLAVAVALPKGTGTIVTEGVGVDEAPDVEVAGVSVSNVGVSGIWLGVGVSAIIVVGVGVIDGSGIGVSVGAVVPWSKVLSSFEPRA